MNFLKQKFFDVIVSYFNKGLDTARQQRITKYEPYFEKIYQVLSWEDPPSSLIIFLVFNYLFWLLVQWQIRFFGLLFLVVLILFIWDSFFKSTKQSDQQTKYTEMVDNMYIVVMDIIYNLKAFRKENSLTFCIGMSLVFFVLNCIARNISGYLISYLILLLSFFIPLGIKLLPEDTKTTIANTILSTFNVKGTLAEEELVPFISDKDFGSRDADLDSLLTDRTADSVSNSLVSGISTIPSFLDMADIENDVEEEDLLPPYTPSDISSDSDVEHKEISLDSSHFNGDSSSEEEKFLEKNTNFPTDFTDDATNSSRFESVRTNIDKIGNFVLSNVLNYAGSSKKTDIKRQNSSSSGSDFEFVSSADVKD